MIRTLIIGLIVAAVATLILSIWQGIVASRLSTGPQKGRAKLASSLCFVATLCTVALIPLLPQWFLPIAEADGHIVSVQMHSHTHSHPTDLQIQEDSGETLHLHASDGNTYFRPGERIMVHYHPSEGGVVDARFFSSDGKGEGLFRDVAPFYSYLGLALCAYLTRAAYKQYRRDPEAAEKPSGRHADADAPTTLGLSTDHSRKLH